LLCLLNIQSLLHNITYFIFIVHLPNKEWTHTYLFCILFIQEQLIFVVEGIAFIAWKIQSPLYKELFLDYSSEIQHSRRPKHKLLYIKFKAPFHHFCPCWLTNTYTYICVMVYRVWPIFRRPGWQPRANNSVDTEYWPVTSP